MNLLLAAALLLQDTPEAAFKKIEAGIERARNVRVLYTLTPASEPQNLSRGTMTLDGESKMKMSADLRSEGASRVAMWMEFENAKIRSSMAGHLVEVKGDGRSVRQNFNVYLTRLGIFAGAIFEHGFWSGASRGTKELAVDLKQLFSLTDFVAVNGCGSNSPAAKSIS